MFSLLVNYCFVGPSWNRPSAWTHNNIQKPKPKTNNNNKEKRKTSKKQLKTTTVINNNSERDRGPYYHKTSTRGDRTGPGRALRSVPATDTNNTSQLYDVFPLVYTIDGVSNTDTIDRKRNSNGEKDHERFIGCVRLSIIGRITCYGVCKRASIRCKSFPGFNMQISICSS